MIPRSLNGVFPYHFNHLQVTFDDGNMVLEDLVGGL